MNGVSDPIIKMEGISRVFPYGQGVHDISLTIQPGEFFALLGPSGCGKTTLLRILSGFERPDSGTLEIAGHSMLHVAPYKRPVHMVFQSYAVFPHMNVFQNVAYGLKVSGYGRSDIQNKVKDILELVRLDTHADSMPRELSGGQQQRVALARALVKEPAVLLLDEPLSALDAKLRDDMRNELVHLQETVHITFVMVTHDQDEALSMANRIAVMNKGEILQVASPELLYEYPQNLFVADFIGHTNIFEGTSRAHAHKEGQAIFSCKLFRDVTASYIGDNPNNLCMVVRPEKIFTLETEPEDAEDILKVVGRVIRFSYYGDVSRVSMNVEGMDVPLLVSVGNVLRDIPYYTFSKDELVWCYWRAQDCMLIAR